MTEAAASVPDASTAHLPLPAAVRPARVFWEFAVGLGALHLLAALAFVPWLFSWTGVVVGLLTFEFFGFGITIGYHRLLTHRSFNCPKWLERTLATVGMFNLQYSPARWVAIHRLHHAHSDREDDPHSPRAGFWWSHFGWIATHSRAHDTEEDFERVARDVLSDPYYVALERRYLWLVVYAVHAAAFFGAGLAVAWARSGDTMEGVRFGCSLLVWGVFLRTVVTLHSTWSVNSVGHRWGYRSHDTRDDSRNNPLVALVSNGEGWHNNHHADQRSARHGLRWWELDPSYIVIRLLERVGLAWDVRSHRAAT